MPADFRWRISRVPLCSKKRGIVRRPYRTTLAVTKEKRNHVSKYLQCFASALAGVDRAQLTGNITRAQRELATAARFERRNMYEAVPGDDQEMEEAAVLHADKRAATWMSSWRVLKDMDKFSGAGEGEPSGDCVLGLARRAADRRGRAVAAPGDAPPPGGAVGSLSEGRGRS